MCLRSVRERAIQTACFEVGGLLLSVPLFAVVSHSSTSDSALLLAAISVAVMTWSPIHNSLFDWLDLRLTGRLASDRPHRWRILHAISHEVSACAVTLPLMLWLTDLSILGALVAEVGLTLFYAAYAYVFHFAYDVMRPVRPQAPAERRVPSLLGLSADPQGT